MEKNNMLCATVGLLVGFAAGFATAKLYLDRKYEDSLKEETNKVAIKVAHDTRMKYKTTLNKLHGILANNTVSDECDISNDKPPKQILDEEVREVKKKAEDLNYIQQTNENADDLIWIPEEWVGNNDSEVIYLTYYPNRDKCLDENGDEVDLINTIGEKNFNKFDDPDVDVVCVRKQDDPHFLVDYVVERDNRDWSDTIGR